MLTVLENANILVSNNGKYVVKKLNIYIQDNRVIGFNLGIPVDDFIDLKNKLLLPQFFNIHCHLGESLYNIDGSDWTISKYLNYTEKIIKHMREDERDAMWMYSAQKTISQLIEHGTGVFCAARSAEIAKGNHICTMSGYPLMLSQKLKQYYLDGLIGFRQYINKNNSTDCSVGVFLHSLYKANKEILKLAKNCLDQQANFITVHVSEDQETRKKEIALFHKLPIFVLHKYGLLTNQTIIIHGGYLSNKELSLISEMNAGIAVCPISNQFLNTKCVDVYELERRNIVWCLATDGLATGRTFSMIKQARELKKLFPQLSNTRILESVTVSPAKFYNRGIYTGRIEKGVRAAFLLLYDFDLEHIENGLERFFSGKTGWEAVWF